MTSDDIKKRLSEMVSHFTFEYDGVSCGVDPISMTNFEIWCGDEFTKVDNIDKVMNIPYFKGKSLKDIAQYITITDQ